MKSATRTIQALFGGVSLSVDPFEEALDGFSEVDRLAAVRSISGKQQRRLWEAAAGRKTTIDDLVPTSVESQIAVIHTGKNSLPVFSDFEKRFSRPSQDADVLYGYNEGLLRPLIGPGYFVAEYVSSRGEVGINYYKVPPSGASLPTGWPDIKPNEEGVQQLVFAKMVDYLRKVSNHVVIGRAYKHGRETANYFLLCRRA